MRIIEIELLSENLIETEKFYSEILGFETEFKSEKLLRFISGNSKISFIKTNIKNPIYHFAFNIPNDQLEQSINWISKKIDLIKSENDSVITDFEKWNAKSIYFNDNNGNILEFIARFDNNNSSARAFDHTSILFVSEIALVTQNVEEAAKKLIIEENLSYFSKQIQRSDFAVFGDDNGLLILVEENRTWFPTNLKATKFWTKIKIEHENKEIEIEHGSIE